MPSDAMVQAWIRELEAEIGPPGAVVRSTAG
jgi:hypothetical protein